MHITNGFRPLKGILFLFTLEVTKLNGTIEQDGFRPLKGILFLFIMREQLLITIASVGSFRPLKGILFLFPIPRPTDITAFFKPNIGGVRDWNILIYSIFFKTVMIRFLIISAENIGKP